MADSNSTCGRPATSVVPDCTGTARIWAFGCVVYEISASLRLVEKTTRFPSGVQIGRVSAAGLVVSRLSVARAKSYVHTAP